MGNQHGHSQHTISKGPAKHDSSSSSDEGFSVNKKHYESLQEVEQDLRKAGLEASSLIVGIDYTISNTSAGKKTFGGKSLHTFQPDGPMNPYQQVITVIGKTLASFDNDGMIPVFGFGDKTTGDKTVFPFHPPPQLCRGFEEVLQRYGEITPGIKLAGPTSFGPLIREAIRIAAQDRSYHILLIIADGQVTPDSEFCKAKSDTINAIVEASKYPLSIIMVGVGDGPWDDMEEFDDGLPARKFDNFQFVNFHKEMSIGTTPKDQEISFAIAALTEIPAQYKKILKLGLNER